MGSSSLEDLKSRKFWLAVLAEMLGTMFLVLVACGSVVTTGNVIAASLCFGFSVATVVHFIAHVSGGHVNPAVTMGFFVTRRISIVRTIFYWAAQVVGAVIGAGLLKALSTSQQSNGGLGTSGPTGLNVGQTFGVELLITFVLVFTVFSAVDGGRSDVGGSVPLTIGVSIAMCHFWAVPITGAGMNPARVFGPAAVSGTWTQHWAYWVGPLIGGAVAGLLYDFLFAVNATPSKIRGFCSRDYDNDNYDRHGRKVPISADASGEELKPTA